MNKIINQPEGMIAEMLAGYLSMYQKQYQLVKIPQILGLKQQSNQAKVALIIGGGAGNEPWVMGYVGQGLATGVALGAVYTSPPARALLTVTEAVYHQKGVLYLSTNHTGDVLNFGLVSELAELAGIETECVFVADDIASETFANKDERRGIAGIALVVKVAGAACERGDSLAEVVRVAQNAANQLATYSVSTSPGYMPGSGRPMFEMAEGTIAFGMGFNGEPGDFESPLLSADEIVKRLIEKLSLDLELQPGVRLVAMINGFGFTSVLELCIVANSVKRLLKERGMLIHDLFMGNFFSPQGTGGFSLSLLVVDNELIELYEAPARAPFFKQGGL